MRDPCEIKVFQPGTAKSSMKRIYPSKKSDIRKPSEIKVFQPGTAKSSMKRIYPSKKSDSHAHVAKQHQTAFAVLLIQMQIA